MHERPGLGPLRPEVSSTQALVFIYIVRSSEEELKWRKTLKNLNRF